MRDVWELRVGLVGVGFLGLCRYFDPEVAHLKSVSEQHAFSHVNYVWVEELIDAQCGMGIGLCHRLGGELAHNTFRLHSHNTAVETGGTK